MRTLAIIIAMLLPGRGAMALSCTAGTTGLVFGAYDPFIPTASAITGMITVSCGPLGLLVSYTIRLDGGSSGSITARTLAGAGANRLSYQLYTDPLHSVVWGDGTAGTATNGGAFLLSVGNASIPYTVYGLLPARQVVAPGPYTDTINVVITY